MAMSYQNYLNRGGPKNHGLKELPKGKPDCLGNLCFLRTGVLDSLDGEDFESLVKQHGGRVVHSVSSIIEPILNLIVFTTFFFRKSKLCRSR